MADLFSVDDLAAYLQTTLDDDKAEIVARLAASRVRAYLRTDPAPFAGTRTVYLSINDNGVVVLPKLLDTVTAVTTTADVALSYSWRPGGRYVYTVHPWLVTNTSLYRSAPPEVKVTYTYTTVPDAVRDAALIIAADIYGPVGVSGGSTNGVQSEQIDDYTVRYLDPATATTTDASSIPADAKELLAPFRQSPGSVRLAAR